LALSIRFTNYLEIMSTSNEWAFVIHAIYKINVWVYRK